MKIKKTQILFLLLISEQIIKKIISQETEISIRTINTLNLHYKYTGFSIAKLGSKIYLFGGQDENFNLNSKLFIFSKNNSSIEEIIPKGDVPQPRRGHSCIIYGNNLIFFGGVGDGSYFNDLHFYNPEKNIFTKIISKSENPDPVSNHKVLLNNDKMYIFGGFTKKGLSNQFFVYNISNNIFTKPFLFGDFPSPREFFGMVLYKENIIIYGGYTNGNHLNDMYFLDLKNKKWQKKIFHQKIKRPKFRQKFNMFLLNGFLLIIGGCNYKISVCYDDIWIFDFDKKLFFEISNEIIGKYSKKIGETQGISFGDNFYFFNNCEMEEHCQNEIFKINFDFIAKKNICNMNGIWTDNTICKCFYGFFGTFCEHQNFCYFSNCNKNEFCSKNENCTEICEKIDCNSINDKKKKKHDGIYSNCLNNCTSTENGFCQFDGNCICSKFWTGKDCSIENLNFEEKKKNLKTITNDKTLEKFTYEMFGFDFQNNFKKSILKKNFGKFEKLTNCLNECSLKYFKKRILFRKKMFL